jgi:hypothetical protein
MGSLLHHSVAISKKNALLWGLFWLLGSAILGWHFSIVPTSVVGYTWGGVALLSEAIYALFILVSLVLPSVVAVLLLNRKADVVELSGRMLYAHAPVTLLMLPAIWGDKVIYSTFMANPFNAQLSSLYVVLMLVFVVTILVWYLYWSFDAFRSVSGRRGWGVLILFCGVEVLSYMLSRVML